MEKTCFVIMPIGNQKYGDTEISESELKNKYEQFIYKAIEKANPSVNILRADEINGPGIVTDQIFLNLLEADYVIADVTQFNPNVFYELGIRHSWRLGTILIKEKNELHVPFDLSNQRYIVYKVDSEGLDNLSNELRKDFESIDNSLGEDDNPVLKYSRLSYKYDNYPKIYTLETMQVPYKYQMDGWENKKYNTINLFGEEFVTLCNDTPHKLSRLVIDENDKYTIKTGVILDLGNGYALEAKEVDSSGNKVWMEFTKDNKYIADQILDLKNGSATWELKLNGIEEKDDVSVLRVNLVGSFRGTVDNIVQIQGIWLIDYENAFTIEIGERFEKFKVLEIGDSYIKFSNNEV